MRSILYAAGVAAGIAAAGSGIPTAQATVITSQSVISGAFSMTRQAIQLGFLSRMKVVYTSAHEAGQIYLPRVNWVLLVAVIAAVVGFGSSSAMAAAYGIAVTVTMLMTTTLTFFVISEGWGIPKPVAVCATTVFPAVDVLLVASCSLKFLQGGWFPLVMGMGVLTAMSTWKRGRQLLFESLERDGLELVPFVESISREDMPRAPRTAVYMVANGGPGRARDARALRRRGYRRGADAHQLLREPRDHRAHARRRHVGLARTPLRRDAAQRGQRRRVLQAAEQRGHRARHPRADLS